MNEVHKEGLKNYVIDGDGHLLARKLEVHEGLKEYVKELI